MPGSEDILPPPAPRPERFRPFLQAFAPRFRGGIYENCRTAPMGKGHGNNNRPFDIESACYLKPVLRTIEQKNTRKVVIKAGVKTLKSFTVEMAAAYYTSHGIGDVSIFFGSGEMADDQSTTRILDYMWGIPSMAKKRETIIDRFDETKGAVKFPDKTLRIRPANIGNTQGVNLCFVGLCDAFVTERSGMIDQAIARTTQYPHDKKIILESQGGEEGFDFDRHYDDTDQGELHIACPFCEMAQVFNWKAWHRERGEDFQAALPKRRVNEILQKYHSEHPTSNLQPPTSNEELEQARKELTETLKSEARRDCGFKRGDDLLIKLPDGEYNEREILRQTHFECYHCGSAIRDDGEFGANRIALDRSSHYVAARTTALPENKGFNFPQWINRRLPWGEIMLEYLKRKKVAEQLGNSEPLKQWWQKCAARTWDAQLSLKAPERPGASIYAIDPAKKFPGEKVRISATDIQFKLTHMIYLAAAVGDGTPPWVLHFEWIKPPAGLTDFQSAEFCKGRVRELDKKFGIEQQNSMKDAAHEPGLVREWAAEDAILARPGPGKRPVWFAYGLLMGDDRMSYKWAHPGRKDTWERFKQYQWHKVLTIKDGKRVMVDVHHRLWSNPSIKEIAGRWRDGEGAPKLKIHEQWLQDRSKEGLWSQLTSERKIPWKGHPGKLHYNNEGRPNHAWDAWCMIVVRMDELGYLNSFGAPPEEVVE